jgi:hypothetical protein
MPRNMIKILKPSQEIHGGMSQNQNMIKSMNLNIWIKCKIDYYYPSYSKEVSNAYEELKTRRNTMLKDLYEREAK